MRLSVFCLAGLLGCVSCLAQSKEIDSLKALLPAAKDTTRFSLLIDIAWKARNIKPIVAIEYAKRAVSYALDTLKQEDKAAKAMNYLGVGYRNVGNYKEALQTFFHAVVLSEKTKDYEVWGYNLQSIGDIYNKQGKFSEAILFLGRSKDAFSKIGNQRGISYCYYTLGQIYLNQKRYKDAIEHYEKALLIRRSTKDIDGAASVANYLGLTYKAMKDYDKALAYHQDALHEYEKINSKRNIAWAKLGIAQVYRLTNRRQEAIQILHDIIPLAKSTNSTDRVRDMYFELAACHADMKDFQKAYEYEQFYIAYKDSVFAQNTRQEKEYLQGAYEKEKKEHELNQLKNQQRVSSLYNFYYAIMVLVGFLLVFAFVGFLIYGNRRQRLVNKMLADKNKEIQTKNEYISSSIAYAKTIQDAVLPAKVFMHEVFPEHFILNRPKDVVSGDFYWLRDFGAEGRILVVADCTGHGVAGAFMTLIGGTLLDKITETKAIYSPQEILQELHHEISGLLRQEQTGNTNGMDAAILHLQAVGKDTHITFCGAKNSIFYALPQTKKIAKIAGDRKGIGGIQNDRIPFQNREITLPKGSMLYIGSDGLADQNDAKRKKIGEPNLCEFLQKIYALPAKDQHEQLAAFLQAHMEGTAQRDDILWIGIRL